MGRNSVSCPHCGFPRTLCFHHSPVETDGEQSQRSGTNKISRNSDKLCTLSVEITQVKRNELKKTCVERGISMKSCLVELVSNFLDARKCDRSKTR